MSAEVAVVDPAAALDAAADPGEFVLLACERGKSWLTEALAHGDLDALANAKGWAVTLRTATMQKQLGKDAELAATELVRRAERCIGLGIRQGQAEGAIRKPSETSRFVPDPASIKNSSLDYLKNASERADVYDLTDGVSDDEFEEALAEAKAEKNLSRANVVRKVRKAPPPDRSSVHYRRRKLDPVRIVNESIAALEAIASGLSLIDDPASLDAEMRLGWLEALRQPLSAINRFKKEISG